MQWLSLEQACVWSRRTIIRVPLVNRTRGDASCSRLSAYLSHHRTKPGCVGTTHREPLTFTPMGVNSKQKMPTRKMLPLLSSSTHHARASRAATLALFAAPHFKACRGQVRR